MKAPAVGIARGNSYVPDHETAAADVCPQLKETDGSLSLAPTGQQGEHSSAWKCARVIADRSIFRHSHFQRRRRISPGMLKFPFEICIPTRDTMVPAGKDWLCKKALFRTH